MNFGATKNTSLLIVKGTKITPQTSVSTIKAPHPSSLLQHLRNGMVNETTPAIHHEKFSSMNQTNALKIGTLLLFWLSAFVPVCFAADASSKLEEMSSETIPTAYLNIDLKTYRNNFDTMGGDGALARSGNDVLLGTREGQFYLIGQDLSVHHAPVPAIDFGIDGFQKSKHFDLIEKGPRLHALLIQDGTIYATYDKYDAKADSIRYVLATFGKDTKTWKELFSSPPLDTKYYTMGGGGRMAALDHYLYFSVGDYGMDRHNKLPSDFASQNPKLPFGKINRMDLSTFRIEPYVIGARNPLGLTADNGKLVMTDNGPRGGDGIYFLKEGDNYGWPYSSFGRHYDDFSTYNSTLNPCKENLAIGCTKHAQPTFVFTPSVAPTQIIKLNGFAPDWNNDFLMGSLKGQTIYHIHVLDERVLYVEPIFVGQRIRDLIQVNNSLWILDDSGLLQILSPSPATTLRAAHSPLPTCVLCHTVNPDPTSATPYAPNLFGVMGRQAGHSNFSGYSIGMKEAAPAIGKWDRANLSAFLHNPAAVVPGTSMPRLPESTSDNAINTILDELQTLH